MKAVQAKTATTSHANSQASAPFFQKKGSESHEAPERTAFFDGKNGVLGGTASPFFNKTGSPAIQTKLTIGQPGNKYEQEADAMAEKVVRGLAGSGQQAVDNSQTGSPAVQAKCAECGEEEKLQLKEGEEGMEEELGIQKKAIFESNEEPPNEPTVQRMCADCAAEEEGKVMKKSDGEASPSASPNLESRLNSTKGGGSPLPANTRSEMEGAFGADFSGVRVHTGSSAVQLNRDLGAQAFAHGSDVYFGAGKYDVGSSSGKGLLAHELTHVVQQNVTSPQIQRKPEPVKGYISDAIQSAFYESSDLHSNLKKLESIQAITPTIYGTQVGDVTMLVSKEDIDKAHAEVKKSIKESIRKMDREELDGFEIYASQRRLDAETGLVAWVSSWGVDDPEAEMWRISLRNMELGNQIYTLLKTNQFVEAGKMLGQYERNSRRIHRLAYNFTQDIIESAGNRIDNLEFIRDVSFTTAGVLATVTMGPVGGAFLGTGFSTAGNIAQQASEVHFGLRDKIDWAGVGFDAAWNLGFSLLVGKLANGLAGQIATKFPTLAASASQAFLTRVASNVIVGRAASMVTTTARMTFDELRGQPVSWDDWGNRMLANLTDLEGIILDAYAGELAHGLTKPATTPPKSSDNGSNNKQTQQPLPDGVTDLNAERARRNPPAVVDNQPNKTEATAANQQGEYQTVNEQQGSNMVKREVWVAHPEPAAPPVVAPTALGTHPTATPSSKAGYAFGVGVMAHQQTKESTKQGGPEIKCISGYELLKAAGDPKPASDSSVLGNICERIIQEDYFQLLGNNPIDDYVDVGDEGGSKMLDFIMTHNPAKFTTAANKQKFRSHRPRRRPDILTDKAGRKEYYEIKPNSISGEDKGIEKVLLIRDMMVKFSLPYVPGNTYSPSGKLILLGVSTTYSTPISVYMLVDLAPGTGLLFYQFCFAGKSVGAMNMNAIAMILRDILMRK